MENLQIYDRIKSSKFNEGCLSHLIDKFDPLLRKYARHLVYEDAYCDLRLDFIEMIAKIDLGTLRRTDDPAMLAYIRSVIKNSYIKRSKASSIHKNNTVYTIYIEEVIIELLPEYQLEMPMNGLFEGIDRDSLKKYLTELELEIIKLTYWDGYNGAEIARFKNLTRQAISQARLRALKKLNYFLSR